MMSKNKFDSPEVQKSAKFYLMLDEIKFQDVIEKIRKTIKKDPRSQKISSCLASALETINQLGQQKIQSNNSSIEENEVVQMQKKLPSTGIQVIPKSCTTCHSINLDALEKGEYAGPPQSVLDEETWKNMVTNEQILGKSLRLPLCISAPWMSFFGDLASSGVDAETLEKIGVDDSKTKYIDVLQKTGDIAQDVSMATKGAVSLAKKEIAAGVPTKQVVKNVLKRAAVDAASTAALDVGMNTIENHLVDQSTEAPDSEHIRSGKNQQHTSVNDIQPLQSVMPTDKDISFFSKLSNLGSTICKFVGDHHLTIGSLAAIIGALALTRDTWSKWIKSAKSKTNQQDDQIEIAVKSIFEVNDISYQLKFNLKSSAWMLTSSNKNSKDLKKDIIQFNHSNFFKKIQTKSKKYLDRLYKNLKTAALLTSIERDETLLHQVSAFGKMWPQARKKIIQDIKI